MRDLNALRIFRDVVKAGGYSAAHRQTGQSRATLSRYITALEEDLGARLIERNTRNFRLTEQGQILYERSQDILSQLDEAFAMVEDLQAKPSGLVRFAIPPALLHLQIGTEILRYMKTYPDVRVHIEVSNRQVDIHNEGVDFVLRARTKLDYPLDDVPVLLARMELSLVMHPSWQKALRSTLLESLEHIPTIAWNGINGQTHWQLMSEDGKTVTVPIQPQLIVDDMAMLRNAALDKLGIIMIPQVYVNEDIALGRLIKLELDLKPFPSLVHAVHLGHRGMRPAVRHLLDWLKQVTKDFR